MGFGVVCEIWPKPLIIRWLHWCSINTTAATGTSPPLVHTTPGTSPPLVHPQPWYIPTPGTSPSLVHPHPWYIPTPGTSPPLVHPNPWYIPPLRILPSRPGKNMSSTNMSVKYAGLRSSIHFSLYIDLCVAAFLCFACDQLLSPAPFWMRWWCYVTCSPTPCMWLLLTTFTPTMTTNAVAGLASSISLLLRDPLRGTSSLALISCWSWRTHFGMCSLGKVSLIVQHDASTRRTVSVLWTPWMALTLYFRRELAPMMLLVVSRPCPESDKELACTS